MRSIASPLRKVIAILVLLAATLAILNVLAYCGANSPIASVRLSKDSDDLPAGVRVHARYSDGSPAVGVSFSYETLSGLTPHVTSDSKGFAFIEQAEDDKVLGLYIADPEKNQYTEIWSSIYESNLFSRLLGIFFDPRVNIEFRVKLDSPSE